MSAFHLLGLFGLCMAVYLFRIGRVHSVRMSFIDEPDFLRSYRRLPTFESMAFHPRHWGRWTVAQWKRYLARQASA